VLASGEGCFPGREIFRNSGCLLIILADNYNHTTNDPTTETQSARRTHRDFSKAIPEGRSLPIFAGYWQPQGRAFAVLGSRLLLVAAARGPGRPGLRRCRKGGLDCLAIARVQGAGGPVGPGSRAHAKARSREDSMRIGQIFARALGPHRWSRSQAKAIRGHSRRPPDGLACTQALVLGGGRRAGPRAGALDSGKGVFPGREIRANRKGGNMQ